MGLIHSEMIEVKLVKGKGRGVFARRAILEGEIIERVPVVVLPVADIKNAEGWVGLAGYCFYWGDGKAALALGYGSLYNHSFLPNARYDDIGRLTKVFSALRDIKAGEEITVNYNGDPNDKQAMGFQVVENPAKSQ